MLQPFLFLELFNELFQGHKRLLSIDELKQNLFPLGCSHSSLKNRIPQMDVLLVAPIHKYGDGCFLQVLLLHLDNVPALGVDRVDHGPNDVDGVLAGSDL